MALPPAEAAEAALDRVAEVPFIDDEPCDLVEAAFIDGWNACLTTVLRGLRRPLDEVPVTGGVL